LILNSIAMLRLILIIVAIYFCNLSYGQRGYSEGYVINSSLDTLQGLVKDRKTNNLDRRLRKIRFISKAGKKRRYSSRQIFGYACAGIEYRSVPIPDRVFARIIIDGELSLLEIQENDPDGAQGLIATSLVLQKGQLRQQAKINRLFFRAIVNPFVRDYEELHQKVVNKVYRFNELELIVNEYNEWVKNGRGKAPKYNKTDYFIK